MKEPIIVLAGFVLVNFVMFPAIIRMTIQRFPQARAPY